MKGGRTEGTHPNVVESQVEKVYWSVEAFQEVWVLICRQDAVRPPGHIETVPSSYHNSKSVNC